MQKLDSAPVKQVNGQKTQIRQEEDEQDMAELL